MLVELQERTSLSIVKMNNSSNDQYQCQTNEHNFLAYRYQSEACIYQCQTNGHNFLSYRYQSEARNYQCQTKMHDRQPVSFLYPVFLVSCFLHYFLIIFFIYLLIATVFL